MIKEDFLVKGWSFLSARNYIELPERKLSVFLRDGRVPLSGRFYGTEEFFNSYPFYSSISFNGNRRLCMRPYIIAPMPEPSIKAIYIDAKRYTYSADGEITGLDTLYELPFVVFKA